MLVTTRTRTAASVSAPSGAAPRVWLQRRGLVMCLKAFQAGFGFWLCLKSPELEQKLQPGLLRGGSRQVYQNACLRFHWRRWRCRRGEGFCSQGVLALGPLFVGGPRLGRF